MPIQSPLHVLISHELPIYYPFKETSQDYLRFLRLYVRFMLITDLIITVGCGFGLDMGSALGLPMSNLNSKHQ